MNCRRILLFLLAAITTTAYKPIQKTHKKGLHQKYSVTTYEENDLPVFHKWLRALPQYKIWLKRKAAMDVWQQKYAALPLPDSAVIIDEKQFETPNGKRTIIAWMTNTDVQLFTDDYEDAYAACARTTTGTGYYTGILHFSLLNTNSRKLINTIEITGADGEFMIYTFSIANPLLQPDRFWIIYAATGGTKAADGTADVIHFIDFNNDGKAYEFALFTLDGCSAPGSTLIGYNDKKDVLKWYNWDITVLDSFKKNAEPASKEKKYWLGPAMAARMDKQGNLQFVENYLARDGALLIYDLHFDKATDNYSGTQTFYDYEPAMLKNMPSARQLREKLKRK